MKTLVPVSAWTTPVRVPEDVVDDLDAITVEEGMQALTNRAEFLKDNKATGAASSVDNGVPRFDGTTGKVIQASGMRISDAVELEYITPKAKTRFVPHFEGVPGSATTWAFGNTFVVGSTNTGEIRFPFRLPAGCILSTVEVMWKPGAARAGANRMALTVIRLTPDWATPDNAPTPISGPHYDDGTTGLDVIATGDLAYTTTDAEILMFSVLAGNTAASSNDRVYGFRVSYTDPGPRT